MRMATEMGSGRLALLLRITAILPLFEGDRKGDTGGMHQHFASDLARDREEEFRRRAETYRLLAEVRRSDPSSRKFLSAWLRWAASVPRSARRMWPRRRPIGRPIPQARGL
jgi:hypothetical protein